MNKTQQKFFADGYQAALRDIKLALEYGGIEAVDSWLKDNMQKYEVKVTYLDIENGDGEP